ncbi:helix-hairpin-helix domain-containing protein [Lachnospiraceae bacterium OttesenSCG-928-E19]|nr:helix-hairpin-helix domain-containing protein [Lachnospiraceae bacterium OttesenSCG-928-E19]
MQWTKVRIIGIVFVILGVLFLGACKKTSQLPLEEIDELEDIEDKSKDDVSKEETTQELYVYVCGEVCVPGVYKLPKESRVYQALEAAGGLTEAAADTYLNQAEEVQDGQNIYVPSKDEVESMGEAMFSGGAQIEQEGRVNLNTASKEELMTLTGIGEAKAIHIIEYRETNGGFRNIEEIKNIPGIKEGVFKKIEDQIMI